MSESAMLSEDIPVNIEETHLFQLAVRRPAGGQARSSSATDIQEAGLKIRPTMTSAGSLYLTLVVQSQTALNGPMMRHHQGMISLR